MTPGQLRAQILSHLHSFFQAAGIEPSSVHDDFDLLASGVIDSLGFLTLVTEIEDWLGRDIDFEEMEPERLTKLGPLCDFVVSQRAGSEGP